MKNEIPVEYAANVVAKPEFISAGSRHGKFALLALTLKNLDSTKALQFSQPEFLQKFGKYGRSTIVSSCKRYGVFAKVAMINDTVYVCGREKSPAKQ